MLDVAGIERPGLSRTSFTVPDGGIATIMGPSGSGKSLLLRAIADMDPNDGGAAIDGILRSSVPAHEWRRMVAYLPAESGWWSDAVADHFRNARDAHSLIEGLGLPEDALSWAVARLSTGEKQRLPFARAMEMQPKALLLDEPTAALDTESEEKVEEVLRAFCGEGGSVIVATHDKMQAKRLGGTFYEMRGGCLRRENASR